MANPTQTAASKMANVKTVRNNSYVTMNVSGAAAESNVKSLIENLKEFDGKPASNVIVNCLHLTEISKSWILIIAMLAERLTVHNKKVRLIYVNASVEKCLAAHGPDARIQKSANLRSGLLELGLTEITVSGGLLVEPFAVAAAQVMKTLISSSASFDSAWVKSPTASALDAPMSGDIMAVVALDSDSLQGSVVISFPEATFFKVMSKMIGSEVKSLTGELQDGAGEIANIVFGHAKVSLNEQGFGFATAIPFVALKGDARLQGLGATRLSTPFETPEGTFSIEIFVRDRAAQNAA